MTTSNLVKGNSMFLYVGTDPLAGSKSVDLAITTKTIDVSSKMSGNWDESIAGKNSYTLNSDFLFSTATGDTNFHSLQAIQATGGTVSFVLGTTTDLTAFSLTKGYYSGTAIINNLSIKGEQDGVLNGSVALTGVGELKPVTV
jgi:predicted secreted protein